MPKAVMVMNVNPITMTLSLVLTPADGMKPPEGSWGVSVSFSLGVGIFSVSFLSF